MKSVSSLFSAILSVVALTVSGHSQPVGSPTKAENPPPARLTPPITEKWSLDTISDVKDWGSIMFIFKRGEEIYRVFAKHRNNRKKANQKQEIEAYFDSAENASIIAPNSEAETELLKFLHSVCIHDPKALKDPWLIWLITVISDRDFPWKGAESKE